MYQYACEATQIHDGDTFTASVDLGFSIHTVATFRLDGLDCPELATKEGKAVAAWVKERFAAFGGKCIVSTRKDLREKYGRMLAVVYFPGEATSLNQQLIDTGRAKPYSGGKR